MLHVSNGGEGGCHRYNSVAPPMACGDPRQAKFREEYKTEMELFKNFARNWSKSVNSVVMSGQEDTLVDHLTLCVMFSCRRSVPFIADGQNPFNPDDGSYRMAPARMSREQLIPALKGSTTISNPRVWDKKTNKFERI